MSVVREPWRKSKKNIAPFGNEKYGEIRGARLRRTAPVREKLVHLEIAIDGDLKSSCGFGKIFEILR